MPAPPPSPHVICLGFFNYKPAKADQETINFEMKMPGSVQKLVHGTLGGGGQGAGDKILPVVAYTGGRLRLRELPFSSCKYMKESQGISRGGVGKTIIKVF